MNKEEIDGEQIQNSNDFQPEQVCTQNRIID
jgi:hypothetical protein